MNGHSQGDGSDFGTRFGREVNHTEHFALARLPAKTALEMALFTARSISVSRPLKRLYKLSKARFVPGHAASPQVPVFGCKNQTGSRGLSHTCVVDINLLDRKVRPPSPVPLSVKQFIRPSQAVHEQPEHVRSYALSSLRSERYAALVADRVTNVGQHLNIARLQKSARIQHTISLLDDCDGCPLRKVSGSHNQL
ncbi:MULTISPECIES: hypothetical protein [unclassified Mesorhizobium]|uniref:hypothetical protein n=1 Tax=unclassified Mesorhizobium TaxID=325217 RepID=UPI0013DF5BD8|nr:MULTISPECIES: hypothetical protein [unclassified Mesorhizobium]